MNNNKDAPTEYASVQEYPAFSMFHPFGLAAAAMQSYALMFGWYNRTIKAVTELMHLTAKNAIDLSLQVQRVQAGLHPKELHLPDGLHYTYLEGGNGDPLLLLHHFGGTKDFLAPVAAYLTSRYRVIIPDQIGFGGSAHPVDVDYSPPAQAKRLRAFVHALGITDLHLGGNSMGGQIALTYAALFPEEVKSLWLLCPTGIWSVRKSAWQTTIEKTGENPLLVRTPDDFLTLLQMAVGSPVPNIPSPILSVLAEPRITNYALEKRIFEDTFSDSVEERVAGLTTPTFIVWGGNDHIVDVDASRILNRLIPSSHVIVMERIGHMPMLENPAHAAWDYLRFRAALDYGAISETP